MEYLKTLETEHALLIQELKELELKYSDLNVSNTQKEQTIKELKIEQTEADDACKTMRRNIKKLQKRQNGVLMFFSGYLGLNPDATPERDKSNRKRNSISPHIKGLNI